MEESPLDLNPVYYFWVAGFIALGALAFFQKDKMRRNVVHVLLVYATLFVGTSIYTTLSNRGEGNAAYTLADKAELLLKLNSGFMSMYRHMPPSKETNKQSEEVKEQFYTESLYSMNQAIKIAPESSILKGKKVILLAETEHPVKEVKAALKDLGDLKSEKAKRLHELLEAVYVKSKVSSADLDKFQSVVKKDVPPGWYQQVAQVELLKAAGKKKEYESGVEKFQEQYVWYVVKLVGFVVVAGIAALIGAIVIVVQLFLLSRKGANPDELNLIKAQGTWGWTAIYGVFIGWLAVEFLAGPVIHHFSSGLANLAMEQGSIPVALMTAFVYLLQNLPALIFIWFFAFRGSNVKFLEGVKFRTKVGKIGIFRLVLSGILTWFAAIPIVLVCTIVAAQFGSQGSSNPIVAIVLTAAKDSNPLGIILFFITLGVLPALCEESLFRGFLYTSLRRSMGAFPAILITAFLFSAAHLDLGGALQLFALGFLFAFVLERTKSIIPCMVAHCMWNSCTFLMALVFFG